MPAASSSASPAPVVSFASQQLGQGARLALPVAGEAKRLARLVGLAQVGVGVDEVAGLPVGGGQGGVGADVVDVGDPAINTVEVDGANLLSAVDMMPPRYNLILNSLALTLSLQLVAHRRHLAATDVAHEPDLATALNNLSVRLAEAGRREGGSGARACRGALSPTSEVGNW